MFQQISLDENSETQFVQRMKDLAEALEMLFNGDAKNDDREFGFLLLAFPLHRSGDSCAYISNLGNEKAVVDLLREQLDRIDGRPRYAS